jgi:ABC-2 type transport system permease protein
MLMLLGGFYIGIFAPMAGGYGFMKAMAFVPIFTPMVAPVAYASGIMSLLEAIIALVVMIGFLIGSLYIVAPVYKVAILSYDQTKFMKRVKSYFKKGFAKNGKK